MYAPYRILPFNHTSPSFFQEEISLNCAQIKTFAPKVLILRFVGEKDGDLESTLGYALQFTKDFAAQEDDDSLTIHHACLFDQELIIPTQTFQFDLPTLIKGACYQTLGQRLPSPLTPPNSFEFLETTYTLKSFDAIEEHLFEGRYGVQA